MPLGEQRRGVCACVYVVGVCVHVCICCGGVHVCVSWGVHMCNVGGVCMCVNVCISNFLFSQMKPFHLWLSIMCLGAVRSASPRLELPLPHFRIQPSCSMNSSQYIF